MNLQRRFGAYTFLLVFLAVLGFTYAEHNPPLFALGSVVSVLTWLLVERPQRGAPRWLINIGVLGACGLLVYEIVVVQQDSLLLALGHFMILILLCKLFERKTTRDYSQIMILSLLVITTASIFNSSLFFAVILATYLAIGLHCALLYHLRGESLYFHNGVSVGLPFSLRRDLRRVAWTCGAAMAVYALVIFIAVPRTRGPAMLSTWGIRSPGMANFADRVYLGEPGRIPDSNMVVMQVKLERDNLNIGSDAEQPYFRAIVLDTYNTNVNQWVHVRDLGQRALNDVLIRNAEAILPGAPTYDPDSAVKQSYTIMHPSTNYLFAIPEPARLTGLPGSTRLQFPIREEVLELSGANTMSELSYVVESVPYFREGFSESARLALKGPAVDSMIRYGDLQEGQFVPRPIPAAIVKKARELAGPVLPTDGSALTGPVVRAIAGRIISELSTYPYSLENPPRADPNMDPTADFLVNRKSVGGHCEFFASAMALMCTSLNIPARMVTGFHGGDFNAVGGFYVVRSHHAHAWVEVLVPGEGWTTFDPTPPAPDVDLSSSFWTRWFQEVFQTIDHRWVSGIIAFDESSRRYIVSGLTDEAAQVPAWLEEQVRLLGTGMLEMGSSSTVPPGVRARFILELVMVGTAAWWLGRQMLRRRRSVVRAMLRGVRGAQRKRLEEGLSFFDEMLAILRRGKKPIGPTQTPMEYVATACAGRPEAHNHAKWLVTTFYDIRFGHGEPTPALRDRIATALTNLRAAMAPVR